MDEKLSNYREHLIQAKQKATEQFDKAVLTLSSGALGVSFSFLDKLVGSGQMQSPISLYGAWLFWGMSVCCSLFSLYMSIKTLQKTIQQVDCGEIYKVKPGGLLSSITESLTILSGVFFILGVCLIAYFVAANH
jgi:hypothetical protein